MLYANLDHINVHFRLKGNFLDMIERIDIRKNLQR